MHKLTFSPSNNGSNSTAILIKETLLKQQDLQVYYVHPLGVKKLPPESIAAYPLAYPSNKVTAKQARDWIAELLPELEADGVELLYVVDAEYFKQLTGNKKAEVHLGYVLPCVIAGYEYMNVVLGSSFASLFHNPAGQQKIDQSLVALSAFANGYYLPPGSDLFKRIEMIKDMQRIKDVLTYLMTKPMITADIEALSLNFRDAGVSTISFAIDQEESYSFAVDTHLGFGLPVKKLLKIFFENYQGTVIWHNAGYDVKVLVYNLWMKSPLDVIGMRKGIEIMTRKFHDTRLIAYLALNSCARVKYSLKTLAQEFSGNYAEQNIDDITKIEPDDLLKYNCADTMATWYVFNKYYQKMIDDNQNDLYEGLFKDSVALLLEMELTGMPIDMDKVLFAEKELQGIEKTQLDTLDSSQIIKDFNYVVQAAACAAKNEKLKIKRVTIADFAHVAFNPSSGPQLQKLLYETLGLPVVDRTKSKAPATGNKTLSKLKKHTTDPAILEVLDALISLAKVSKILTAFIPAFKNSWLKEDGCYYLHGNYNLGFVVSGRLSSSNPNLQNLPSGSTYGKLIKDCFIAPLGWLMAGADFASLEDKISALTTKDPNKLKVYSGLKIYELTINGTIHHIREDSIIEYDGKSLTAEEFYAAYC